MTTEDASIHRSSGTSAAGHPCIPQYEIRVSGHLEPRWAIWFDGLTLTIEDDGITVMRGSLVDQAALHGLLQKLRDLGIPLVSLTQLPPDTPTDGSDLRSHPIPQRQPGATS